MKFKYAFVSSLIGRAVSAVACEGRKRWFEPCRRLLVLRRRRFLGTVAGDGRERWFEPCWRLIVLRRRRARCQRPYSGAAAP